MRWWCGALVLCACGRLGYEPLGLVDNPPDSGVIGFADAKTNASAMGGTWTLGSTVALDAVNSTQDDWEISISDDGLVVYLSSWRDPSVGRSDLWTATRANASSPFGSSVHDLELSSPMEDRTPRLSGDALTLLYTSNRGTTLGTWDLWLAKRGSRSAPFETPTNITELNTTDAEEPGFLSEDGLRIYFSCHRTGIGSSGSADFWFASRATPSIPFDAPAPLTELNSPQAERTLFLSRDELLAIFASDREGGRGGYDLYWSKRARRTDAFSPPTAFTDLNTATDDWAPFLSADGATLYYNTGRAVDGSGVEDAELTAVKVLSSP